MEAGRTIEYRAYSVKFEPLVRFLNLRCHDKRKVKSIDFKYNVPILLV